MFALTTLSDVQSEVLQGGSSNGNNRPNRPNRPNRHSGGDITQVVTTTNYYVDISQLSSANAITLDGKYSQAWNTVTQFAAVTIG